MPVRSMSAGSTPATIGAALTDATLRLRRSGSPSARLDAELLLAHMTGHERSWVLAHPDAPLEEPRAFGDVLGRRAAGEPIAYIRGFKEWRSLRIRTDARALIPRPETELLVEEAMTAIAARLTRDAAPVVAWDVATGSGVLALAMALHFRRALALGTLRIIASDVSPRALDLAAENLAAHGVARDVTLVCADLLGPAQVPPPRPDVIVANLPYVATAEVDAGRGSLAFEPRLALDGGPDGLALIRRFLAQLPEGATPGATVLLEIGAGHGDAVAALAPAGASVSMVRDLAGLDRIVRIRLAD